MYAGGSGVGVSVYDGRAFLGELAFGADAAGLAAFRDYLRQEPDIVSSLIVDMIEEEYRNETIPHLLGRSRHAVIARRLEQSYRATPYRAAQVQSRLEEGRRDDRVLLTALTNPDAIAACLAPLAEHSVPLAGIYSAPMLAPSLLRRLGVRSEHVLLLTRNRQGALRQTFLHRGELRNSRLSPLGAGEYTATQLAQEIEKNRRYLNRLHLFAHDAVLDVVIVGEREMVEQLHASWRNTETLRHHLVALEEAAEAVGLADGTAVPDCERLFVHLLQRSTPPVNYAPAADRRGYIHYQGRKAMFAASLVMVLAAAAWAGASVRDGLEYDRQSAEAVRSITSLRDDYASVVAGQPQMDVDTEQMRWMVDAGDAIGQMSATPWEMLRAISAGVTAHPAIRIDEVDWDSAQPAGSSGLAESDLTAGQVVNAVAGEHAVIKGRVASHGGSLRTAVNLVDAFMETLRRQGRFDAVDAIAMPMNTDPAATVSGIAGAQPDDTGASFSIRVVLRGDA